MLVGLCVLCVSVAKSQPLPPLPQVPALRARALYFAVTDVDSHGLSSAWSNELVWTNGSANLTNLSWDAPTGPVDHYVLYWGYQSRTYIFSRRLTTATNQPWPIPPPPPIWQKTFTWLSLSDTALNRGLNGTNGWITNAITLCTITGAPPAAMAFDRAGQIRWTRIQ